MITVRNLNKVYKTRFGTKQVLKDVSFDLARGEKLGILGRNGAGKSTLIRLIGGAEKPTSGTITSTMSISWPLAFGGAFQSELTGLDNVRFISRIYNQDFEYNLAFVERFSELGSYLREPVRTYSSGMMARLAFAISMIIEFDCFLIDEIASVGDARFYERCNYELFDKRGDRAMIIISHDAGYVRDHCNRWAVLDQGRMVHFDDFEEAYPFFLKQVGVGSYTPTEPQPFSRRMAAIDALCRVAHADDTFMMLVREADRARDAHDWARAESGYLEALAQHPYERSYWAQLGHVTREQGKLERAEIAYRTACSFGIAASALTPFIEAVNPSALSDARMPLAAPENGPTAKQPPGYPDIALLAALFRGSETLTTSEFLDLIRHSARLEDVAASMLATMAAETSGPAPQVPETVALVPDPEREKRDWLEDLCRLTGADHGKVKAGLARRNRPGCDRLLAELIAAGGFARWDVEGLEAHAKFVEERVDG